MSAKEQQNRQRLYVSKPIQGRVLRRFCGYWILYHVFLFLVLAMDTLLSGQAHSFPQLWESMWREHFWTFVLLFGAAPIIFRDLLITTHRLAGPLLRFERVLKQMTCGQRVEKVQLRERDLLDEFQEVFNEFIEVRNAELDAATADVEQRQYEEITS